MKDSSSSVFCGHLWYLPIEAETRILQPIVVIDKAVEFVNWKSRNLYMGRGVSRKGYLVLRRSGTYLPVVVYRAQVCSRCCSARCHCRRILGTGVGK